MTPAAGPGDASSASAHGDLGRIVDQRSVIAVCGPGGVGKTTTAASLALAAARRGRVACVLTIDPARRLAQTLGIDGGGDGPHEIDVGAGRGRLVAVSLDAKRTFDELVRRHAPRPETSDRILRNRVYRELSSAVSGSQEYMAVEKLYELHETGDYDTIVLDTPPTRHAVDFLDAPARVAGFVNGAALRAFRRGGDGGRPAFRALGSASALAWRTAERVTGEGVLNEIAEFFSAFDGMYAGFRDRAAAARALLAEPSTAFLIVTTPEREPLDEALSFRQRLEEGGLPFGGAIVNRRHTSPLSESGIVGVEPAPGAAQEALASAGAPVELAAEAARALGFVEARARADGLIVAELRDAIGPSPVFEIPLVHHRPLTDLAGLSVLADALLERP